MLIYNSNPLLTPFANMTKTEHRIIAILRKTPSTIADLVSTLELSRNAVVFQLGQMESKGLVERGDARHTRKAGKPAREYRATDGQEDSMSSAYKPFATALVEHASHHMPRAAFKRLMKDVGKGIALAAGINDQWPLDERLEAARKVVDELGANTELDRESDSYVIRSHNCPLASAVRSNGCVCAAVASFFSEATGCTVEEQCSREKQLVCRFKLMDKRA